jgi:hypothetical protein
MPLAGGGIEQCYNTQAAVAVGSMMVVAVAMVQGTNDNQDLEPSPSVSRDPTTGARVTISSPSIGCSMFNKDRSIPARGDFYLLSMI